MDKIKLEIKRDEITKNNTAEVLELVSNTNVVTKELVLHKFVAKDVMINRMIAVAGQMFIEYEKEKDNSNQIFKGYEEYIGNERI